MILLAKTNYSFFNRIFESQIMSKEVSKPIKIDSNLFEILTMWLKSKEAGIKGYHSKSVFCTEAVRDLLEQNMGKKPLYTDLITLLTDQKDLIATLKNTSLQVEEHMTYIKKLEHFWFKANFPNIEST